MRKRYGGCYDPQKVWANLPVFGPRSEFVRYDRWTGNIQSIRRIWAAPDSATWETSQDSIALAMTRREAASLDCGEGGRHPALTHISGVEIWRFDEFDVRLLAYSHIPGNASAKWLLQIDVFQDAAPECGGEVV